MAWTWAKIKREWLGEMRIALPPDAAVAAFDRVDAMLGSDWLAQSRQPGTLGAAPTIHVAAVGQLLGALEGLYGHESLLADLRAGKQGAWAELDALYLLRVAAPYLSVRLHPPVLVKGREKVPDIGVRDQSTEPWVYVEVASPEESNEHARVMAAATGLAGLIDRVPGRYALELFLRREPTDAEAAAIEARVGALAVLSTASEEELPHGLGRLFLNHRIPGQMVIDDHGEHDRGPGLGIARFIAQRVGDGRDIAVRVPFTDKRADDFLRREARQLPEAGPGLLMFHLRQGQTGPWERLMMRRLERGLHQRVSGVCLFSSALMPTPAGEQWRPEARLIRNPNARVPLPLWAEALRSFEVREDIRSRLTRGVREWKPGRRIERRVAQDSYGEEPILQFGPVQLVRMTGQPANSPSRTG